MSTPRSTTNGFYCQNALCTKHETMSYVDMVKWGFFKFCSKECLKSFQVNRFGVYYPISKKTKHEKK